MASVPRGLHRFVWVLSIGALGCGGGGGDEAALEEPDQGQTPADVGDGLPLCGPAGDVRADPRPAFEDTDASVHELITCGGAQFTLMGGFVGQVLASNRGFLDPEVRKYLVPSRPPFANDGAGYWQMAIGSAPGSTFHVTFHRPDDAKGEHPLVEDVFSLESYLRGVRVQGAPSALQLATQPDRRWDFQFSWDADGPLADLLGLQGASDRTLTLKLSANDLQALYASGDFGGSKSAYGPFARLLELPTRSHATVVDERGWTRIRYEATGPARPMREMLDGGTIHFVFDTLEAESDGVSLTGEAENLRFLSMGVLAGDIHYRFEGLGLAGLVADSDFGEGASYPQTTWRCEDE